MKKLRGSEWALWDLHVHSPASYHWKGNERAGWRDLNTKDAVLAQMVEVINKSEVALFAIMDYWTFDGILSLREYDRQNPDVLTKTVLPGIELRVQAPKADRLDIHAIFSEDIPDQRLRDFLATLKVQLMNGEELPLSRDCLIEYARALRDDQLSYHGINRDRLNTDDDYAWEKGCGTCEVTLDSFKQAMRGAPEDMAVVFQPWDTYHGLSDAKWQQHYTSAYQLFQQPDIFECKDVRYRSAFLGVKTSDNAKYFQGFWTALQQRARLAVRGSDAHSFGSYGKFQSNLPTWIKASPTFRGLLQAIKEPAERSWLGDEPPKRVKCRSKPTVFIDTITLRKTADHGLNKEDWFDGQVIPMNPDLVAIIGSKGSGKSALADICGLLGNTGNTTGFTFLNSSRFRDRKNNRSRHFEGELKWFNGEAVMRRLSEDPLPGTIERVRYIPHAYFEKICRGESEGDLAEFTRQVERVIFSYVPHELRGGTTDLQDLLRRQEDEANRNLERIRAEVRTLNGRICDIRRRSSGQVRSELMAQLKLRQKQLEDLRKAEPQLPPPQENDAQPDPNWASLKELEAEKETFGAQMNEARQRLIELQQKTQAAARLIDGLHNLETMVRENLDRMVPEALLVGLDISTVATLAIDYETVVQAQDRAASARDAQTRLVDGPDSLASRLETLEERIKTAKSLLDAKQLEQQAARERYANWQSEVSALEGNTELESSVAHVQAQLDWVDDDAPAEIRKFEVGRLARTNEIAEQLLGVKAAREELIVKAMSAIDSVIPKHDGFSLGFVNELIITGLEDRFFERIKRISGTFRGEEEGLRAFRDLVDATPLTTIDEIGAVAQRLELAAIEDHRDGSVQALSLDSLLRKGKSPEDFLNLLYGLDYVRPRFTLALGGQPLAQLSPGQRGALLLVFYLLVEESDIPIVLDQPEENLDNETVFSLLVKVIKKAKAKRQILMVTHNANLAVCCDAEQIIHASHDKGNHNKVRYTSGPIEDPRINKLVVNVLEGTHPAFTNRREKYHVA